MQRLFIIGLMGAVFSFFVANQLLAKTYTFSNPGKAVPTQNDVDERRVKAVLDRIDTLATQMQQLTLSQQQTNKQLKQLLEFTYMNQRYLKTVALASQKKGSVKEEEKNTLAIDPQKATFAELTRVTKEQNETLRLLATLMNQITSEQKLTNNLLEAYLEK